jgi:hypothetical protein
MRTISNLSFIGLTKTTWAAAKLDRLLLSIRIILPIESVPTSDRPFGLPSQTGLET